MHMILNVLPKISQYFAGKVSLERERAKDRSALIIWSYDDSLTHSYREILLVHLLWGMVGKDQVQ